MGYTPVRKCIHIEINTRFNLIHEKEWTGNTISSICKSNAYPERPTTSGKIGTNRKGLMDYQISLEGLILSSITRR